MLRADLLSIAFAGLAVAADDSSRAVSAINSLGVDLLRSDAIPGGNTVFSPYSVQVALSMVYAGAAGKTRLQMASALHYEGDDLTGAFIALQGQLDTMVKHSREFAARMAGPEESALPSIQLEAANRLFGKTGFAFRPAYLSLMADQYRAPLQPLDFGKDPSGEARSINTWISRQTHGHITDLVPESAMTSLTRLVLVNAIYLKAPWEEPFEKSNTVQRPFLTATAGRPFYIPTMVDVRQLGYQRQGDFTVISLPYLGDDLHFLILLPDSPAGLPALEKKISGDFLKKCAHLPGALVKLWLPRFKLEPAAIDLSQILKHLGMPSAFDIPPGSANFDGIAPANGPDYLYISAVLHEAFISVDEAGTEAAAATAVAMMAGSAPSVQKPIEVEVNRPFLFAVQQPSTGVCLFLGRMTGPP